MRTEGILFFFLVVQSTSSFQIRLAAYIHRGENNNNKNNRLYIAVGASTEQTSPWGEGWGRVGVLMAAEGYTNCANEPQGPNSSSIIKQSSTRR